MKKRFMTAVLSGIMAAGMVMQAMAGSAGGAVPAASGTDVFAGIIIEDIDAKINVNVPTLFAFVVKGSVDGENTGVTSANGDIYLPNAKVDVITPSVDGTGAVYSLQMVGDGLLSFTNYSTQDNGSGDREGLAVSINGNIKNEGTPESRNYWTHTNSANTTTGDFKKYNISVDGNKFDTLANGGYEMAAGIDLAAPVTDPEGDSSFTNVDPDTDYAIVGETHYAAFDVLVGGEKGAYTQVEESAKVGHIVWTVSAELEGDVDTAPGNDFLDGPPSTDIVVDPWETAPVTPSL